MMFRSLQLEPSATETAETTEVAEVTETEVVETEEEWIME
jgi:hypothetical protein